MYQRSISRSTPGCVVILLDRSDSMKRPWGTTGLTLADGAARAINKILLELCVRSTKEVGGDMRRYFDVGIFGYGITPRGEEGVASALPPPLSGHGIVPLPTVAEHPLALRENASVDAMGPGARMPVWVDPANGYRTPMCEAIAVAGGHVYEWVNAHSDSFPPIVINITDGFVTDSPYESIDLEGWAKRLTMIETSDGPSLLLNVFLADSPAEATWFPPSGRNLPEPGAQLLEISSPLPQPMIDNAHAQGIPTSAGARGLVFNADLAMLVSFLQIGTRFDVHDR